MYQEYYNFSADPFRLSPDHNFAYAHKGYRKAWAYMEYAFMQAEGFVMITGRPGTGKTTLIGALLAKLANTSVSIANLVSTQLQSDDLLKLVAYDFGIPDSVVEKGELLQRLTRQLKTWHREGRRALLIVDEAQDLSVSAMEELRLLTNIQVDSRPLLQIFLLGQPELRELILSPRLEQVHQRIIAASHLRPLEQDETEAYIRHRLETVNWRGNPAISKSVYPLIYKFSEGVPRRINLICSRLLLHCAVEERQQVGVADVREVVKELQEENLASGDNFVESDFLVADIFEDDLDAGKEDGSSAQEQATQTAPPDNAGGETVSNDRRPESNQSGVTPSGNDRSETNDTNARQAAPSERSAPDGNRVPATREQGKTTPAGKTQAVLAPRTPISHTENRTPGNPGSRAPHSALASESFGSTGMAGRGPNGKTPPTQLTGAGRKGNAGQGNNPGWGNDSETGSSPGLKNSTRPSDNHETGKSPAPKNQPDPKTRQDAHDPDARASWPKILITCVTVVLVSFGNWN